MLDKHAHAAEYLLPFLKPGAKVLDVGSGSGYTVAVLHHLLQRENSENGGGQVVGVEHVPELTKWSCENLSRDGLKAFVDSGQIKMVTGDGRLGRREPLGRSPALGSSS